MQSKTKLSLAAKIREEMRASLLDLIMWSFKIPSYFSQIARSMVRLVTVRSAPIASVAKRALSAKTLLFLDSNLSSCRTRYQPQPKIMGRQETMMTRANLLWKTKATITHTTRLNREIKTMAMFIPSNCCSWVGSVVMRVVRMPTELQDSSKNEICFVITL
jgi:hypothetical protein